MAWALVDDKYFSNPKITALPVPVSYMYLASLAFANGYMTDGIITPPGLMIIATQAKIKNAKAAAKSLVEAELWEVVDEGWFIHDYFEYNKSRDFILAEREKKAAAGSKGGKASAAASAKADAIANAKARAKKLLEQNASKSPAISPSPIPLKQITTTSYAPDEKFSQFVAVFQELTGITPKMADYELEAVKRIIDAGASVDDYRAAIEGLQAKDYTANNLASPEKWVMQELEGKKQPKRSNNGNHKPKRDALDEILDGAPIFAEDK